MRTLPLLLFLTLSPLVAHAQENETAPAPIETVPAPIEATSVPIETAPAPIETPVLNEFWEYEPMPVLEPVPEAVISPRERFRAGRIQFRISGGIELRGLSISQLLSVIDGWYTGGAAIDLGVVNFGSVTIGVGVEGSYARQPFLNPMLGARAWLDDNIPRWVPRILIPIPLDPGPAGDWRWFPKDQTISGRLHVHLNSVPGRPYIVGSLGQTSYRLDIEHREDGRSATLEDTLLIGQIGAGGTRVLANNLVINGELLFGRRLLSAVPGRFALDPDDFTDDLAVLTRTLPPSSFRFSLGLGYRL